MDHNEVYNLSLVFSQKIWDLVQRWPAFAKDTNGKQIVRSADSVSATLKEGFGRYFYKDRNVFNYYSRGSLLETHCWLVKAHNRNLLTTEQFESLLIDFNVLQIEINRMIKNTRDQISPK